MSFVYRSQHYLGSYQPVENGYNFPIWSRIDRTIHSTTTTSSETTYAWRKDTQPSAATDWLTIKIGGDDLIGKKCKQLHNTNRIKSTKYSLLTFIPQNLLEQFRRIANFYFLVMTIIGCLIDGPVSPLTSLLPLAFVISVTAAKQGYEDFLRYKTDNIVNCSPVTVIRNGNEQNIYCQDVVQGDLVLVYRDCDVPCDLVLLKSSDINDKCFVTTANLDGESNLKTLIIPRNLPKYEQNKLHTLGTIMCEVPKFDLYNFNGKIKLNPNPNPNPNPNSNSNTTNNDTQYYTNDIEEQLTNIPLTTDNLLLRGSRIKNTEYVIGCAVYTGMNTKLALNSRLTRNKVASSEKYVNKFLVFVLVSLICMVTFCYLLKRYYENYIIEYHKYLGPAVNTTEISSFLQDYLSFLILFNYLIPISLYVTIEMNRILGAFFMEWDANLYDEITDQQCIVNTSNLNEELGQVNILFSDKTGTLTKNEMIFQQCSINCRKYIFRQSKLEEANTNLFFDINKFNEDQKVFFQALALCHTVQVAGKATLIHEEDDRISQTEIVQNIYSFSNITEESVNSNTNLDEPDNVLLPSKLKRDSPLDSNLLLRKTTLEEKRSKIAKRSPRFARSSRIYPSKIGNSESSLDDKQLRLPPVPPTPLDQFRNQHGVQFNRSTSQIDLPIHSQSYPDYHQAHRRTQSYGAHPNGQRSNGILTAPVLMRTASTISRESYASPNFITMGRSSSMTRAESQRRQKEIQTVVDNLDYQASSPDEKALIEACANLGIVYMGDNNDVLKIQICPPHLDYSRPYSLMTCKELLFKRLHVIEFTSDRKRMSIIVRDNNNEIWIYTKGAESYVFPLCQTEQTISMEKLHKTNDDIGEFAQQGLRTLAVARRKLTELEYREFQSEFIKAHQSLDDQHRLYELCYAKVERNLELLGATAVEDALQDDVRDTLIALQGAGMKIWVLTGDKVETALNIAISCGHIPVNSFKYFMVECKSKDDMDQHLTALEHELKANTNIPGALLIDGKSLAIALVEAPVRFRDIAIRCQAVLCCRLSPLQKCEVVQLIKTSPQNYITAAIGDGANDVSMIQEAHVGIGIVGKEGRQAARCADFAFAKFNLLKRLMLVHGHYHTSRLSFLVLYFFYKNSVFMGVQMLFQFHTMFSSTSIYDSLFLTLYNVVYTAMPILFISLTEKRFSEDKLMETPQLYIRNINNRALHWGEFISWTLIAIYHAILCFYATYYVFTLNNVIFPSGISADFSSFGTILIQNVVVVVNFKLWLETTYQSYFYIFTIWASIVGFIITTFIYNIINIRYDTDIYWTYFNLFTSIPFYLLLVIVVVAALLPDYTIRVCKLALNMPKIKFFPGPKDVKRKPNQMMMTTTAESPNTNNYQSTNF